ncbi:hypothetical protein JCM5350_001359 [Sporobolomyces pararoseus]
MSFVDVSPSKLPVVTPPMLPPELVDEILREATLTSSDLARCSLVSRQFYYSSRQSLYDTLTVAFDLEEYSEQHPEGEGGGGGGGGGEAHEECRICLLWRTLQASPIAQSLVTALSFIGIESPLDEEDRYPTASNVVEKMLDLLQTVAVLSFDVYFWRIYAVKDLVIDLEKRWTRLTVSGVDIDWDFRESSFPNLKKLECADLWSDDGEAKLFLPPILDTLDVKSAANPIPSFPNSTTSILQVLRLPLIPSDLPDLSGFPQLRHLYLYQEEEARYGTRFSWKPIAQCTSIRSLSIGLVIVERSRRFLRFLQSLPVFLERLDFPLAIPFDALLTLFRQTNLPASLRILGLSSVHSSNTEKTSLTVPLRKLCKEKGIEIEMIDWRRDLFRVPLTSP